MRLNLPILDDLLSCKNLLIAGMGGGFDIFCGLPIYFELCQRGQNVHLANYSFSLLSGLPDLTPLGAGMIGVHADVNTWLPYFPELYLSQWFRDKCGEEITIWAFPKTGVRPLLENYQALVEHLSIDGILLIDGGVDSLMHGDEAGVGTIIEDSISLCAVNELKQIRKRFTASVAFGAEQDIAYAHVFENVASLTAADAYLGSCSLIKQMEVYQRYEDAVSYVQNQPGQDPSVINSSLVSAVQGHHGDYHHTEKTRGSKLWISPLMPIYWFFDFHGVAKRNMLLPELRWTDTMSDAIREAWKFMQRTPRRRAARIPLG